MCFHQLSHQPTNKWAGVIYTRKLQETPCLTPLPWGVGFHKPPTVQGQSAAKPTQVLLLLWVGRFRDYNRVPARVRNSPSPPAMVLLFIINLHAQKARIQRVLWSPESNAALRYGMYFRGEKTDSLLRIRYVSGRLSWDRMVCEASSRGNSSSNSVY